MPGARKILVVEDDSQLRHLFHSVLTVAGYAVAHVGDGLDALRQLDPDPPDLVVLDLNLPRLGGLAVQEEISSRADMRYIPIVVVTGDPGGLGERDGLCILKKPVDTDVLLATIRRCLSKIQPVI